ncbi:MAG: M28 family metallopeptidase [Pseudomonadota bacterium]
MKQTVASLLAAIALVACSADAPAPGSAPDAPASPEVAPTQTDALPMPLPTSTTAEITTSDLAVRIEALADDRFEGRGPGAPVGEKAADWIAQDMARIGLQPGGDDGSWFQTVGMVEQTIDPETSSLTFSGGLSERDYPMDLGTDAVIWTKQQTAETVAFDSSDVVFVGYGVVAPEYGWNDYDGLDVAGKTVVMLVNDPGFATENPDLFKGKAMTYYGRWTYKFEEAARQGAAAAILVHETAPASYGWDVVSNSWSGAQADLVRADGGAGRVTLEAWISVDTARSLFADGGLDFEAMKEAAKSADFTPVRMGGLTASGGITQTIDRLESRNVVGVIPGETAPDEYVLFTAHWDHLGKKTGEKTGEPGEDFYRDDIFNGAVDNATGVAGILEIAEAMAGETLDRSALFVAVTLEESGLLGSAYYAENPTVPLNQVVAGINIDAYRPVGKTEEMVVIGYGASELEAMLETVLAETGRTVKPDTKPEAGFFYRSDHVSFAKKGVPMLYAKNGVETVDGGESVGKAFEASYTIQRYHKPMDEYADTWDLAGLVEDVGALKTLGLQIAQSSEWPTWYAGNEFEAIRQESLAAGGVQ